MERIGCDFDGTLVDYGFKPGEPVKVNTVLLEQLRGKKITIITNQGGLGFGLMSATRPGETRKYPTPQDFFDRFMVFVEIAKSYDIRIDELHVSLYHQKLTAVLIEEVWLKMHELFDSTYIVDKTFVYETVISRKPKPLMLQWAEITVYFGDSDEDRQAAEAAGVRFIEVERFMG